MIIENHLGRGRQKIMADSTQKRGSKEIINNCLEKEQEELRMQYVQMVQQSYKMGDQIHREENRSSSHQNRSSGQQNQRGSQRNRSSKAVSRNSRTEGQCDRSRSSNSIGQSATKNRSDARRREIKRKQKKRKQRFFLICQAVFLILTVILVAGIVMLFRNINGSVYAGEFSGTGQIQQSVQNEQDVKNGQDAQTGADMQNGQAAQTGADMQAEVAANSKDAVGSSGSQNITSYAGQCEVGEIEAPVKRNASEINEKLLELSEGNEKIAEIYEDRSICPENMLEALAANPEMADFVLGYIEQKKNGAEDWTDNGTTYASLTEEEKSMEYPLFLQWDPRWGYAAYGDDSYVGLAGCGPTALSMALYYLTGEESLTPDRLAVYAMDNGYYMYGTGTLWAFMEEAPEEYGVTVNKPGISGDIMRQELDDGNIIICAMRPGDFTAAGHFIVIYGYDEEGFLVNDPNCVARSKQSWSFDRIKKQIKQLWSLG